VPWLVWIPFVLSALICIGFFLVPAFVIRPFRYQAPRALWIAMAMRQRAPQGTLIAGGVCLLLAALLWSSTGKWLRVALVVSVALVAFSAAMARLNYFEWMFHPVKDPQFDTEAGSKLDAKEMVMTVRFGSDARAYPISEMAYHHILNDVVGGVPIAVTY